MKDDAIKRAAKADAALASEPTGSRPEFVSKCCAAQVRSVCSEIDDPEWCSRWYACSKCGQPCDTVEGRP